ncbi:MAG: hypothetical protein AAGF55_04690 [Pseudomonadota bacterium]
MKKMMKRVGKAVWSHRAVYLGLAMAYGAKCTGLIDAELLAQLVTALYCALFSQRH